jgi:hypothetical protein
VKVFAFQFSFERLYESVQGRRSRDAALTSPLASCSAALLRRFGLRAVFGNRLLQ